MKKVIITGGAGFIGSNLVDKLLKKKIKITVIDNLTTGFKNHLKTDKNIKFLKCDLLEKKRLNKIFKGHDFVFHLAANADIKDGLKHPKKDLEQNAIATFNVLEAMRINKIKKIVFTSTAPVYGNTSEFPTKENAAMSYQTSLYGASKLYCEGLISSYCEGYQFQSWIFRFVSILGPRYSHGHVYDFVKMLLKDNSKLPVLGNGRQRKSYIHVHDCINAILFAIKNSKNKVNIFNLGHNNYINVNKSIEIISRIMNCNPKLIYTGGSRGWVGDLPFVFLDNKKIKKTGWKPKLSIEESIKQTTNWLLQNQWIFRKRK